MRDKMTAKWDFWIDRGGTFTDIVGRAPDGRFIRTSFCPRTPSAIAMPPLQGMREMLGVEKAPVCPIRLIRTVKMGTTVATNALLERKGERTAPASSRKRFRRCCCASAIRRARGIFDLDIIKPECCYERGLLRLMSGSTPTARCRSHWMRQARARHAGGVDDGIRAVAIVLMHAYLLPRP
jgi:5-oxoprolinase (ATP-hydrolysing)